MAGDDLAKVLAKRAKFRRDVCARMIQRKMRPWLARIIRQRAFISKVCEQGGVYEQLRLQAIIAAWRRFTDEEAERWAKGVTFNGHRPGYLWQDGNQEMKERKFIVFFDHLAIVDAKSGETVSNIQFSQIRRVTKGVEQKKHDVTVQLKTGHKEIYKLLNSIGFFAAFQFNLMKWLHREARKSSKRKSMRNLDIFQEDAKNKGPEIIDFKPKPAPDLPLPAERAEASGQDVTGLTPALRLACQSGLDKSGLFGPVQRPWKDDWIALRQDHTKRQTYQEWKDMGPRVPFGSNQNYIYLVPIGDLEEHDGGCEIRCLADFTRSYFHGVRVETLPAIPLRGLHRDRGMRLHIELTGFDSEAACKDTSVPVQLNEMEKYLRQLLPNNAFMLVGVTLHEVCAGPGYVRGSPYMTLPEVREHANRRRLCVLSLSRLDPWYRRSTAKDFYTMETRETRKALLVRRACRWLGHHIMLFFDMDHCVYHSCLMNGFVSLEEMHYVPLQVCPICLRKLLDAIGVKTSSRCIERYSAMRRFCHVNNRVFAREKRWYDVRIKSLEKRHLQYLTDKELERLFGVMLPEQETLSLPAVAT